VRFKISIKFEISHCAWTKWLLWICRYSILQLFSVSFHLSKQNISSRSGKTTTIIAFENCETYWREKVCIFEKSQCEVVATGNYTLTEFEYSGLRRLFINVLRNSTSVHKMWYFKTFNKPVVKWSVLSVFINLHCAGSVCLYYGLRV